MAHQYRTCVLHTTTTTAQQAVMKDSYKVFILTKIKLAHQRAHQYQLLYFTPPPLQPVMKDSSIVFTLTKSIWHTKGHTNIKHLW